MILDQLPVNILRFVCTFIFIKFIFCETYDHAVSILQNKTLNYERSLRPVRNQSSTLILNISFGVVSIQDFDEVKESLTVVGGLTLTWIDEFMTWNPSDYGGIKDIVSDSGKFWMPHLIMLTNVNKLDKTGESWQRVRFTHEGEALVIQADAFSTLCSVDLTYFPWDSHWCDFEFSTVAYSSLEMSIQPMFDTVTTSYLKENGAWKFIDSYVTGRYDNASMLFSIRLERKPLYVLVNIILPIIALAFLNAVIFLIPADSGERISYSITVLLAVAVFLTLVGDNLPKKSNPMPIFSFYLLTILIISVVITLLNIFSLRLYHRDRTQPVPNVFASLSRFWRNKTTRFKRNKTVENINTAADECKDKETDMSGDSLDNQNVLHSHRSRDCKALTWKSVSNSFDKVCFIFFCVILLTSTSIYFVIIYAKHD